MNSPTDLLVCKDDSRYHHSGEPGFHEVFLSVKESYIQSSRVLVDLKLWLEARPDVNWLEQQISWTLAIRRTCTPMPACGRKAPKSEEPQLGRAYGLFS